MLQADFSKPVLKPLILGPELLHLHNSYSNIHVLQQIAILWKEDLVKDQLVDFVLCTLLFQESKTSFVWAVLCNTGNSLADHGKQPSQLKAGQKAVDSVAWKVFFFLKSFASSSTFTTQVSVTLGAVNTIGIALIALSVDLASTLSPPLTLKMLPLQSCQP